LDSRLDSLDTDSDATADDNDLDDDVAVAVEEVGAGRLNGKLRWKLDNPFASKPGGG
jgi:hypothetical protein